MSTSPNLSLPYIAAGQAQKHVTFNECATLLDDVVQLCLLDRDLSTPPPAPAAGARYLVAANPEGAWLGKAGQIAGWDGFGWNFRAPRAGWLAWLADEEKLVLHDGAGWIDSAGLIGSHLQNLALVGINATADTTNRLAVSSPASLFDHAGGHHRLTVNKSAPANTASLVLQESYLGRAEIGLTGDNNLSMKVSADGSGWKTALSVDHQTGRISMPQTPVARSPGLLLNGDFRINQRGFPGGALSAGSYGFDRWKAGGSGASLSLAGGVLTLGSGTILQVIDPVHWGLDSFVGVPVTVSLEDPSAAISVTFGTATGVIQAGTGRRSITLPPAAAPGPVALQLSPVAAPAAFRRVKLEPGTVASDWLQVSTPASVAACQAFYFKSYPMNVAPGSIEPLGQITHRDTGLNTIEKGFLNLRCPVSMRATPTITWYSPQTGQAGRVWHWTGNLDRLVDQTIGASSVTSGHPRLQAGVGDINHFWTAHVTLEAEH